MVSQAKGIWGTAQEVPGTAALNQDGLAVINAVSCGAPGYCSAGGHYTEITGDEEAFVVTETNGTWGSAEEVPGLAALNTGGDAQITSLSCASATHCSAGGYYTQSLGGNFGSEQAFVVNET